MSRPLIRIAPEYEHLRPYLENIEEHFAGGRVIHSGRNEIRAVTPPGGPELNVKRYRVPIWINRVAYTFLRKPKGVRAFEYPRVLLEKGFETPAPVAYIERREGGLIAFSYFVSVQSGLRRRFFEFGDATEEQFGPVMRAFARLTARLHEAGIIHRDYSPGNILFDSDGRGGWLFSLVDINRMEFRPVDFREGLRGFVRLWGQPEMFDLLAREYALARGADPDAASAELLAYRERFWKRWARNHKIKFNLRY